jgi:hypothetical protein
MGLLGGQALLGCGGSSASGEVGGVELEVRDAFYTEFEWNGVPYSVVVLTDVEDACNAFRANDPDLGATYGVFQLWLSGVDVASYPVYSISHLDEVTGGDPYAISWYQAVINDQEVVNTDGVAGVVQVASFDYEDKQISGNMDVLFSGNGNRLQGSFSAAWCEVDWTEYAEASQP